MDLLPFHYFFSYFLFSLVFSSSFPYLSLPNLIFISLPLYFLSFSLSYCTSLFLSPLFSPFYILSLLCSPLLLYCFLSCFLTFYCFLFSCIYFLALSFFLSSLLFSFFPLFFLIFSVLGFIFLLFHFSLPSPFFNFFLLYLFFCFLFSLPYLFPSFSPLLFLSFLLCWVCLGQQPNAHPAFPSPSPTGNREKRG